MDFIFVFSCTLWILRIWFTLSFMSSNISKFKPLIISWLTLKPKSISNNVHLRYLFAISIRFSSADQFKFERSLTDIFLPSLQSSLVPTKVKKFSITLAYYIHSFTYRSTPFVDVFLLCWITDGFQWVSDWINNSVSVSDRKVNIFSEQNDTQKEKRRKMESEAV